MDLKPVPEDLRRLADEPSPHRVRKAVWRGRAVWVKTAAGSHSRARRICQKALALLMPVAALKPAAAGGGAASLRHEAERIAAFRAAGFDAPEVLGLSERWMILEDLGVVIDTEIKTAPGMTAERLSVIGRECARTIAALHRAGLSHGRCKLNDLVRLPSGGIGFIDFEESAGDMPLRTRQARELWFFSVSLARYLSLQPDLLREAFSTYAGDHAGPEIREELRKLLKFLKPAVTVLFPLRPLLRGDAARALDATRELLLLEKKGIL